jgi:hypothetical protein
VGLLFILLYPEPLRTTPEIWGWEGDVSFAVRGGHGGNELGDLLLLRRGGEAGIRHWVACAPGGLQLRSWGRFPICRRRGA